MTAQTETRTMPDTDTWEVFLIDVDGFTRRDDERALAILRLFADDRAIEREFGDCLPEKITVCRRDAKPIPQSPGSDFLREPWSRPTIDFLDFDLVDEHDSHRAVLLWRAAQGAARALNGDV